VLVLAFADSILRQALDSFLSLGMTQVAWRRVNLRTKDGGSLHTKPLLDNFEHPILDLGAAVAVIGVMECLENLTKGQYGNVTKPLISSTLLMTSSGFELSDQAFNKIQGYNSSRNKRCAGMTNLDNELYGVLDNSLCNLAGGLIQNNTEVVLRGDQRPVHQPEHQMHLGENTVGWV